LQATEAKDAAADAAQDAQKRASDAAGAAQDKASELTGAAKEKGSQLGDQANQAKDQAGQKVKPIYHLFVILSKCWQYPIRVGHSLTKLCWYMCGIPSKGDAASF
jgi:hypothetical protein